MAENQTPDLVIYSRIRTDAKRAALERLAQVNSAGVVNQDVHQLTSAAAEVPRKLVN